MPYNMSGLTPIDSGKKYDLSGLTPIGQSDVTGGLIDDAEDLGRGAIQGASLHTAPMISGGIQALGHKLTDEDDQDLSALYHKYQKLSQEGFDKSAERSPVLNTAGELAGGIGVGLATAGAAAPAVAGTTLREAAALGGGALAKEVGKRAAVGAATGAAIGGVNSIGESKGALIGATPEEEKQLESDIKTGLASGATLGGAISTVASGLGMSANKAIDYFEKSGNPFLKKLSQNYKFGLENVNPHSAEEREFGVNGKAPLNTLDRASSGELTNKILDTDKSLGEKVGQSLTDAEANGVMVPTGKIADKSSRALDALSQLDPKLVDSLSIGEDGLLADPEMSAGTQFQQPKAKFLDLLGRLSQNDEVSPTEAKAAIDHMDNLLDGMKGITDLPTNNARQVIGGLRSSLNDSLKENLPEYAQAAKQFESFRRNVPETIISGSKPVENSGVYFGNLKNKAGKLDDEVNSMLMGKNIAGNLEEQKTFTNLNQGLTNLKNEGNSEALQLMGIEDDGQSNIRHFMDNVDKKSVESATRQGANSAIPTPPGGGMTQTITRNVLGYGAEKVQHIFNKIGRLQAPSEVSSAVANASDEELGKVGQIVSKIPGLSHIGESLSKAVSDNKSSALKNAAIFSILQNPQARQAIYEASGGEPK